LVGCLTAPPFIEVHVHSQKSERSFVWGVYFDPFNDITNVFWNCCDNMVYFAFNFIVTF
jgi:hypothetical protein